MQLEDDGIMLDAFALSYLPSSFCAFQESMTQFTSLWAFTDEPGAAELSYTIFPPIVIKRLRTKSCRFLL